MDAAQPSGTFAHLHLHTEYSLLDGGNQIEKLVARVAELGMKACAITDHGNIFGAVAFYAACKEKGIKPILGVEAYVTPPGKPRTDRTYSGGGEGGYHLVLLAENNTGWQNLLKLCSQAYLTGFYYKPRIDRELLAAHSEGLIAINGHLGSEIGEHLLAYSRSGEQRHWDAAVESAAWHAAAFGGGKKWQSGEVAKWQSEEKAPTAASGTLPLPRFFIELQHHVPEQNAINPLLIRLARELGLPLVCDNDAHFLRAEDHDAHDTLICISTGKGKFDDSRMHYTPELYVKSPAQMEGLFGGEDYNNAKFGEAGREALANAASIAERCQVELPLGRNNAPAVQIDLPAASALPKHDDPRYAGDMSAWYKDYCAAFELKPFKSVPTPEELAASKVNCDAALRMLAEAGFVWRYGGEERDSAFGIRHSEETNAESRMPNAVAADRRARLERELKILADKNISAYFLIVWDFVNWGRQRGIPANARGSGVGTMVGYVLGLSNACPVEFGLLFERFTDPDRTEYPDIDIDLCQDGRGEVINYVRQKYGHVAQIITFGTLKARAAIRDVGRVLEIPLPEVDRIAKLVPEQLNITIEEALKAEPELAKLRDSDERYRQLLDNAIALEGHTRHAGVHAAGVIVATRPLDEIVPLYKQPGNDSNDIITQWDGPTCEKMGLLKMDFLGLRTLSVIERAKKLIRDTMSEGEIWAAVGRDAKDGGPHPLDLERIAPTDPKVFTLFQRAETTGVFQFESGGMRRLLVEMKPDRLEDLIAANALFRPGPMDLIPDYNRRKHGTEEVPKVHEIVDRYTAETYGVMVYQEQVMQIVHGLGGIKLRDAYTLIKNISKKKHDKIEKERPKFVEGAQKQGLSKQAAEELFQLILKFAGYGFNKSHSTGYAIVAYQTAYLKTYFPHQYMAAFLTYESQANKASDWIPYLEDCRRTRRIDPATGETIGVGVEVKPPDINLSMADFAVVREGTGDRGLGTGEKAVVADERGTTKAESRMPNAGAAHIRFGLKAIKGVGDKAIEAVIVERAKGGAFASLHEFCERMPPGVITKSMLESLITCGAFDSVHGRQNRAAMLGTIEGAMSAGQRLAADKAAGQSGLFGGGGAGGGGGAASAPKQAAPLARAEAWSETETLRREKETLGFYVSSHPLERWRAWGGAFATTTTAAAKELTQDQRVVMAVMVQSARTIVIRNGKNAGQKMAILTVEDLAGACEVVLFADAYVKFQHLATNEAVVFVLGRLDLSRGDPQIIADRLVPIDCVPVDAGRLRLFLDETKLNGHAQAALASVAKQLQERTLTPTTKRDTPGEGAPSLFSVEVVLGLQDSVAVLAADPKLRVTLAPAVVQSIEAELGQGMVKVAASLAFEKQEPKKKWERRRGGDED
ncbi:MAG: DNA polymerase III subunit alpha [Tepidisphaera sp.]|nr:DNA polymerase III subunit alpha [Tepidisphaera sp.]